MKRNGKIWKGQSRKEIRSDGKEYNLWSKTKK
jgi:hypothetical protein